MKSSYLRDQRGVAMLLELVLVAVVVSIVGLAVYQVNHRTKTTTTTTQSTPAAASSTEGLAASAAAIAEQDAAAEAVISSDAEAAASELSEAGEDVTNLGGSSDASF